LQKFVEDYFNSKLNECDNSEKKPGKIAINNIKKIFADNFYLEIYKGSKETFLCSYLDKL